MRRADRPTCSFGWGVHDGSALNQERARSQRIHGATFLVSIAREGVAVPMSGEPLMSAQTSLLSIDELAVRLRTTVNALYCRAHRNPASLPPRVSIPGDRRWHFHLLVVDEWIANPQAFLPQPKRGPGRPKKRGSSW